MAIENTAIFSNGIFPSFPLPVTKIVGGGPGASSIIRRKEKGVCVMPKFKFFKLDNEEVLEATANIKNVTLENGDNINVTIGRIKTEDS